MKSTLLVLITPMVLLLSNFKPATPEPKAPTATFTMLRAHETGNGYNLQWKMSSTAGIQGFRVESTYEDPTDPYSVWQVRGQVGQTQGVNQFRDNNLLQGILNYRVIALSSGNAPVAVSDILTVTVH